MASTQARTLLGRPYRHMRRWWRHTPSSDAALTLIALGLVLIVVAVVLAVFVFRA
ncbi:MAG: hypothetical protein ACR2LF_04590 [Jatrophihabitantaceae bacterium]